MTPSIELAPPQRELSLIAIDAAEELQRYHLGLDFKLEAVKALSSLLRRSFNQDSSTSGQNCPLDATTMISSALSIIDGAPSSRTISEVAAQAVRFATELETETKGAEIGNLINFCVALSDSAALYQEELEEFQKRSV